MRLSCLLHCFLRSYLVCAASNPYGLQNVGFTYAMQPGLEAIHQNQEARREATGRYVERFNCHPFFAPLLMGILLRAEADAAKNPACQPVPQALRTTAANTLSALGDVCISGGGAATWVLVTALLLFAGQATLALGLLVCVFLLAQCARGAGFFLGWKMGVAVLAAIARWHPMHVAVAIKYCNALLLAFFLFCAMPSLHWWQMTAVVICLFASVWLGERLHVPRWLLVGWNFAWFLLLYLYTIPVA